MHGNGDDRYAALAARVAELEAAVRLLTARWEHELVPRLVTIDEELDQHAEAIAKYIVR